MLSNQKSINFLLHKLAIFSVNDFKIRICENFLREGLWVLYCWWNVNWKAEFSNWVTWKISFLKSALNCLLTLFNHFWSWESSFFLFFLLQFIFLLLWLFLQRWNGLYPLIESRNQIFDVFYKLHPFPCPRCYFGFWLFVSPPICSPIKCDPLSAWHYGKGTCSSLACLWFIRA
jgi:hypothetical protein